MSRHIAASAFLQLPSGAAVHPCRLIHKDGTLMWCHAIGGHELESLACESHIIKTAARLEELNSWVSVGLEIWQCLQPLRWYVPGDPLFGEGICARITHPMFTPPELYAVMSKHIGEFEQLELDEGAVLFNRCSAS